MTDRRDGFLSFVFAANIGATATLGMMEQFDIYPTIAIPIGIAVGAISWFKYEACERSDRHD